MVQDEIQKHISNLFMDLGIGWKAADALIEIGEPAVPNLIKMLDKKHYEGTRVRAARALGEIGAPAAAKALAKQLKSKYFNVKYEARKALIKIGEPAVPHFIKELKNRDRDRRLQAVWALRDIGDPAAAEALRKTCKDKDFQVSKEAGEALENLQVDQKTKT